MHLHSGYYYHNYVILGVLKPLWLNRNSLYRLNNNNKNYNLILKCQFDTMKSMNRYVQKSLSNRLSIVLGGKTLTIIIILIIIIIIILQCGARLQIHTLICVSGAFSQLGMRMSASVSRSCRSVAVLSTLSVSHPCMCRLQACHPHASTS